MQKLRLKGDCYREVGTMGSSHLPDNSRVVKFIFCGVGSISLVHFSRVIVSLLCLKKHRHGSSVDVFLIDHKGDLKHSFNANVNTKCNTY